MSVNDSLWRGLKPTSVCLLAYRLTGGPHRLTFSKNLARIGFLYFSILFPPFFSLIFFLSFLAEIEMKSIVGGFVCDTAIDPQSRQLFMSGFCREI